MLYVVTMVSQDSAIRKDMRSFCLKLLKSFEELMNLGRGHMPDEKAFKAQKDLVFREMCWRMLKEKHAKDIK